MNTRQVSLALLVGVALLGAAGWLATRNDGSTSNSDAGSRLSPQLKARINSVDEIRLRKGDGTRTTLRRSGTAWTVVERAYPADTGKVRRLLLDLGDLEAVEQKTRDPTRYGVLGVEDLASPAATGNLVEVQAGNTKLLSIIVGKASGARESYVRPLPGVITYLAKPQLTPDATPQRWLDTALLDIKPERVRSVAIALVDATPYVAERATRNVADLTISKLPRGRVISGPSAATGLASALADLALEDVVADSRVRATAADAVPTATVTTFDGLTVVLQGRADGERRFVTVTLTSAAGSGAAANATALETAALRARVAGWSFEIPAYKYSALFRPLDEMLLPVVPSAGLARPRNEEQRRGSQ